MTRIARPCLMSPTARPNAMTEATGISSSDQICRMLVQRVGVLVGVRRIGVHEPAAVGAEFLDGFLARHRAHRDRLLGAFQRRHVDRAEQGLRHAARGHHERDDDRKRQQQIERDARHIDPEIANRCRGRALKGAHQRESDGEPGRGGQEIVNGEAEHLGQMAHRRLAAVVLPVGVGDETDRRVEGEIRGYGVKALRVQRQMVLQPLQREQRDEAGDRKCDHGDRVDVPALLTLFVHACKSVEGDLDRPQDGREEIALAEIDLLDELAKRYGRGKHEEKHDRDLRPAESGHDDVQSEAIRIFRDR